MRIEGEDDDRSLLAQLVPRAVLRAPFISKELGALRSVATQDDCVIVTFEGGFSLHLHAASSTFGAALLGALHRLDPQAGVERPSEPSRHTETRPRPVNGGASRGRKL
jgi:hypothetical protein